MHTIPRFPHPFPDDRGDYRMNVEPHVAGRPGTPFAARFDLDAHYLDEVAERERVLLADPARCQVLPHMHLAEWDTIELLMESLAHDYPADFALERNGERWRWQNHRLGIDQAFTFGDPATLPRPPFEYISRQLQGDFTLHDQQNGTLTLDGGMLTTQAGWSLDFNLGMDFHALHAPVPADATADLFDRALAFLLALRVGEPVRRVNWGLTASRRMDLSPETHHHWAHERCTVNADNVGERVHLRVELQALFRLPRSNAILFSIRAYLVSLNALRLVPEQAQRLRRVLQTLPPSVIAYKDLNRYHHLVLDHLAHPSC